MNMKARKPLPHAPQPSVQVDLSQAETLKCTECSNILFIQAYIVKRISPLISPNGKEMLAPVEVFSCGNCGAVPEQFNQAIKPVSPEDATV